MIATTPQNVIIKIVLILILVLLMSCDNKTDHIKKSAESIQATRNLNSKLNIVTLQTQWLHQAQFAGFYVAHKKGFYNNYGIDVRIQMGGPDNPSSVALQNNKANFVTMFLTSALREIDKESKIVNIAQLSQKSSMLLVAKKSKGITQIKDLNGKRIGLWVNDFREPSITFLNKNNIKATIVPISWTVNVLNQDVVDVMNMMIYNEFDILINTGINQNELTIFPLADLGVNIPEDGIYCLKDYYNQNQELCHDFAEASMEGWNYALNHEEETLSIVLEYLREAHLPANIPHQRWMLKKVKEAVLAKPEQYGKLTEKDYNSAINMLIENGVISKSVPYKDFIGYAVSK